MILRLSVMPCLRGLTNPLITLAIVLEGSGGSGGLLLLVTGQCWSA